MSADARKQPLQDRDQERALPHGRFNQRHLSQVTVRRVAREVKQRFDNPPSGVHPSMLRLDQGCNSHSLTVNGPGL